MLARVAELNRKSLQKQLLQQSGIVYLKAGVLQDRKWTDTEIPFRQESNFFYLTGCNEPGYHFTLDLTNGKSTLYVPDYPPDYSLWCGKPKTRDQVREQYQVDECLSVSLLDAVLKKQKTIHVIENAELDKYPTNASVLREALAECRMIKNELEVELMQKACKISSEAHIALMKSVKPSKGTELDYVALFEYECRVRGGRFQAYNAIVGGGLNPAILHHYSSDAPFPSNPDALVLVDAGCEYHCYASDITRTYPLGGVFKGEYKTIYEIVLEANKTVIENMKPGVEWEDMHRLASLVILRGLVKCGIVKGDEKELIENHVAALFFPHGLGHSLGIDVHDAGGYPFGVERIQEPGLKYLRMRRTLKPGMVVTVEPGIYFVDSLLYPAKDDPKFAKFLNVDILEQYRKVGGVRIEDDVLVTETGTMVLNSTPKEISEIEAIMAQ